MDHPANSFAALCQVMGNWYISRDGIPLNDSPRDEFIPVIVFESVWS